MNARWVLVMVGVGCLATAGCGSQAPPGARAAAGPPVADPPASAAAAACPVGSYEVSRLTPGESSDAGDPDVRLSGGTSMTIELAADGNWTLTDDGSSPLKARMKGPGGASVTATATVRGSLHGTFVRSGDSYGFDFARSGGDGTVEISSPAGRESKSIDSVGSAIVPDGSASVRCSGETATVTSESVTMTLRRSDGGVAVAAGGARGPKDTDDKGEDKGDVKPDDDGTEDGDESSGGDQPRVGPDGTLILEGRSTSYDIRCDGQDVEIRASVSTVSLRGSCDRVDINGNRNRVAIEAAEVVDIEGNRNEVFIGDAGDVDDDGSGNRVRGD